MLLQIARNLTYVLNDNDQEGELDGKRFVVFSWAGDKVCGNVGAHDLEDGGLNVAIRQSLNVTIADLLVPNLEGLGSIIKNKPLLENSEQK